MAAAGTVAVLLPTTAYMLRLRAPPARALIDAGVPVALGSDFNPNAYCYDMCMVMHLACCTFGMSMEEALVAATINAAASIGRGRTHGALGVGRRGDAVLLAARDWRHLIYRRVHTSCNPLTHPLQIRLFNRAHHARGQRRQRSHRQ